MQAFRELITRRDHAQAGALLQAAGLELPEGITFGLGCYEDAALAGVGFLAGNVLCGICVQPSRQGAGLASAIVSRLIRHAAALGTHKLMLFTTPAEMSKFRELGLRPVAQSRHAALLEFGQPDCAAWLEQARAAIDRLKQAARSGPLLPVPAQDEATAGAVVMNANPFTLGHLHLVRTALLACAWVYVLVVEEDAAAFPFDVRLDLVRRGLARHPRAVVLPAGPYMVSRASFPAYFTGKAAHGRMHAELDSAIFAARIAGALGIGVRFVGREARCEVSAQYNAALQEILPQHGINCVEIERLACGSRAISASRVRELLAGPDTEAVRAELGTLVPDATLGFLRSDAMQGMRESLREHAGRHFCPPKPVAEDAV